MNEFFSAFERDLMHQWAAKYAPGLSAHVDTIRITHRDLTGVGFYSYFAYSEPVAAVEVWPKGSPCIIFALPDGRSGGATVCIENGLAAYIEVFANGDDDIAVAEIDYRFIEN